MGLESGSQKKILTDPGVKSQDPGSGSATLFCSVPEGFFIRVTSDYSAKLILEYEFIRSKPDKLLLNFMVRLLNTTAVSY
jgi:hypothetical protein